MKGKTSEKRMDRLRQPRNGHICFSQKLSLWPPDSDKLCPLHLNKVMDARIWWQRNTKIPVKFSTQIQHSHGGIHVRIAPSPNQFSLIFRHSKIGSASLFSLPRVVKKLGIWSRITLWVLNSNGHCGHLAPFRFHLFGLHSPNFNS